MIAAHSLGWKNDFGDFHSDLSKILGLLFCRPRILLHTYLILYHRQIPLYNRRRQQEFLFYSAKAYRDHIGLDGCYRANAKRLMLDLDTNLDFGNIHLDRRFWLSG